MRKHPTKNLRLCEPHESRVEINASFLSCALILAGTGIGADKKDLGFYFLKIYFQSHDNSLRETEFLSGQLQPLR